MVASVSRAVGSQDERFQRIEARTSRVENRMDALEHTIAANRQAGADENKATHGLLQEALRRLGEPMNGPSQPASGLYYAIETVSDRVKPFEKMREWLKGSLATITFIALPGGAVIWFLCGAKLTALLHG